jgi:hypothetical protein
MNTMPTKNPLLNLTPAQFAKYVHGIVRKEKMQLKSLSVERLKTVDGSDGGYELDLVATFSVYGEAIIRFLIECKR